MSTVLNESTAHTATSPSQRLRRTMAAVRVSIRWFGIRRRPDGRTEGRGCRTVQRRSPLPVRR